MNKDNYKIGTIGTASTDIETLAGTIPKGARVQIVGIDDGQPSRGYDLLDLDTGLTLTETGFDSIIPVRSDEIKFEIGTIGIASRDIEALSGTIPKGARVKIVGIDDGQPSRGYDLLDLDTGLTSTETGFDSIIPTVFENVNDINKGTSKR